MDILSNLNLKVGDKVEFNGGTWNPYTIKLVKGELKAVLDGREDSCGTYVDGSIQPNWEVISRVGEPKYKNWGKMTDAEKGELLLAHHNGETIQVSDMSYNFWDTPTPCWYRCSYYRVKPEPEVCPTVVSAWVDRVDGEIDWSTLRKDK